jgi:hypothetical protein
MQLSASIFYLLVALFLAPSHAAQPANGPVPRSPVVVPFELTQNVIFFHILLNGSDPLWFSLDTGAGTAYLDAHVATRLGLQPQGSGTVHGAGAGDVPVQYLDSVRFGFPGFDSPGHRVTVTDLQTLSEEFGREEDGFLGYDLLSRYVVIVDYAAGTMTILNPSSFRYDGKGHAFPLTFRHRWPYIRATIKVPGLAPQSEEFLVDAGSGDAVDDPAILKSTAPLRSVKTGVGLGSPGEGQLGRAEYLELGPWRLKGPVTSCCSSNPDDKVKIGGEVLRRFRVIYDYPHEQIILEPNASFAEPFPNA